MKKLVFLSSLILIILVSGCAQKVVRYGSVIGVKEESLAKYKELHAEILAKRTWKR